MPGSKRRFEPAETILRAEIEDQAELRALLEQIEGLGLDLIEFRQVGSGRGSTEEKAGS